MLNHLARRGPVLDPTHCSLPSPSKNKVHRVVQPRLAAQGEALGDAVEQLEVAGGAVEAALVAHVQPL